MNLPRRKPTRLRDFNYSKPGWFFVTICTQNKKKLFGDLKNQKMIINETGKILEIIWDGLPKHFPSIAIDEFMVMPNHVHGIVTINEPSIIVGNRHACSLQKDDRQHQILPVVIGAFKSAATKYFNQQNKTTKSIWQKSYHDHIIRNEYEYFEIKKYIRNNPLHWLDDENYV